MNKTEQADIKLPFVARFRNIVTAMFLIRRMANVAGGGGVHDVAEGCSRAGFINRRAAAWYRVLASIIPGPEMFSWNFSF